MNSKTILRKVFGVALCAMIGVPALAWANPPMEGREMRGDPPAMRNDFVGRPPMPMMGKLPRLSEDQMEKSFVIHHQFELPLHEKQRMVHKLSTALRDLSRTDKYDEGKAKEIAANLAGAVADLQLLLSKRDAQLYALLTAEQKSDMAKEGNHHELPPRPDCEKDAHGK